MAASAGEGDNDSDTAPPTGPKQVAAVLLLLLTVTSAIVTLLVVLGDRGNGVIAAVGVVLTLVSLVLRVAVTPGEIREILRPPESRTQVTVAAVLGLLLSAGVAAGVYAVARVPEIPLLAASVRIDGADELGPGSPATLVFDGPTPARSTLGLGLRLVDDVGSGDCTTSATLTLAPRVGAIERTPILVPTPGTGTANPDLAEVPVGGSVPDLRVRVVVDTDPGCRLRLVLTEAVFYG